MKFKKKIIIFILLVSISLLSLVGCRGSLNINKASKNLTSYAIDAVFCDEDKKVSAVEKVCYVNNKDTILNFICFNLYGKAFSDDYGIKPYSKQKTNECFPNGVNYGDIIITSVLVNNQNATYSFVGECNNAVEVALFEPLYQGEKVEIEIVFDLYLANCTHRLGYNDNSVNLGNWYPIAAVFDGGEFKIDPYYANGDPFYSDCANYEVCLTYSNKYTLASTGSKVSSKEENGMITENFSAKAVRDFAMCLATDYMVEEVEVDGIILSVYAYSGDNKILDYLETAKKAVLLFNELFGEYPYEKLSIAFTDFFQGGMEYPGLVYISDSVQELIEIKKVIVHEIAHEWWYGVVGKNEVEDAWFDEGLAEYSTLLYFESYEDEGVDVKKMINDTIVNYELYLDVVKSLNLKVNYSMSLNVSEYSSEYEYVYMIYVKGLLFFHDLRNKVGYDDFVQFLKTIYNKYAFKTINKELFVAELENVVECDMKEYVEEWLSGKVEIS